MPTNFFGTVRQNFFIKKSWQRSAQSIKIFILCFYKYFYWWVPWRSFSALWNEHFRRKIVILPIMHKIFRYPNFSETLKGCPRKFLGTVTPIIFDGETWYPLPLWCIKFSISQFLWNSEGVPTKFFCTVTPKFFEGKTWYPLLCINFFDIANFLKHWIDGHEFFRHSETKNVRRKNVIPLFIHKIFETRTFSKTVVFPYEVFRYCETTYFLQTFVILPSYA